MKKILIITVITLSFLSCSKWGERGEACISADTSTVNSGESITVSNCGDVLPSEYVEPELDWGDGSITSGQTGTHTYEATGEYTIKLLLNGDYAADVTDVDESKVKLEITVN